MMNSKAKTTPPLRGTPPQEGNNSPSLKGGQAKPDGVVPKLRFPEFRGGALRSVRLGDVTEEGRSRNGNKHSVASVMGVTKADGIVPMEARLIAADIARYKVVEKDWFAYNPMRLNIGSIARWKGESEILVSPDYVVFKCNTDSESGIDPGYLDYFRQTKTWEEFVTEGGDGSVRVRIYYKDIARVGLALPSLAEQQKIAECLSSVDELMAAQARKVDALKTHKKGLMQQLFPREGETQPRLRFPEFQNAGEWKKEPLGSMCARIMDGTHFSPKSKGGPRPYLTSKNIKDGRIDLSNLSYISEEEHAEIYSKCPVKLHDVLLTKDGANTGNCALNNLDFEFSLLSSVAVLRGNPSKLRQEFLFQSILSDSAQSLITESMSGQAITRITLTKIGGITISVPSPGEQRRIASCLSSLDALITSETQKLEALKTHKKGLMQQLFPSPEEAEA